MILPFHSQGSPPKKCDVIRGISRMDIRLRVWIARILSCKYLALHTGHMSFGHKFVSCEFEIGIPRSRMKFHECVIAKRSPPKLTCRIDNRRTLKPLIRFECLDNALSRFYRVKKGFPNSNAFGPIWKAIRLLPVPSRSVRMTSLPSLSGDNSNTSASACADNR